MNYSDQKHLIIIGAQRSGSTFLRAMLDQHPDIYMSRPVNPEPKYFLRNDPSLSGYLQSVFSGAPKSTLYLGEKSTSYYEIPGIARRIKSVIPDAKLIIVLRNPVNRAISNFTFSANSGLETRSMEQAFLMGAAEPEYSSSISVNPFNYLARGDYLTLLTPYKELFGNNLHIVLFEEMVAGGQLSDLYQFLSLMTPTKESLGLIERNASEPLNAPKEVTDYLKDHFSSKIDVLETVFNLDLSSWKK